MLTADVRRFMYGPKPPEGCPGCTFETDNLVGAVVHLAHHVPTPRRPGNMLDVMELMAVSVFALHRGVVYHTYSTYDRGTEALNATWQLLDRAPMGRGESFAGWPRKRDEYAAA